jgi:DNA-binding response OmpR family regulator
MGASGWKGEGKMKKILIVDNDQGIRMLYAYELAEEGYEVTTCGDGSRVMESINKECPDLVVMEIRLGKYDGLDLLQDIRNAYEELPVIICTAYPSFRHDLKSVAADDYVLKSLDLKELKLKIERAFERRKRKIPAGFHCTMGQAKTTFYRQTDVPGKSAPQSSWRKGGDIFCSSRPVAGSMLPSGKRGRAKC